MPYVSIWVEPEDCDGSCVAAREFREMQARLDEAERLLRAGDAEAALHALTDDPALPIKKPDEIEEDYRRWKAGKLPGFTNYAATAQPRDA